MVTRIGARNTLDPRIASFAHGAGLALGAAAILVSLSCGEVLDGTTSIPDGPVSPVAPVAPAAGGATYAASLSGTVTDTGGQAIAGALVESGGRSALADAMGRFELLSVPLAAGRVATVTASKTGFVALTRLVEPNVAGGSRFDLTLKRVALVTSIDAASGGIVVTPDRRGVLVVPAGVIVDADGQAVSGGVEVTFTVFDPATTDVGAYPGEFFGLKRNGEWGVLGSVAMATVEIRRGDKRYTVREGASLQVEVVVSQELNLQANEIPAWTFSGDGGYWDESGSARAIASTVLGDKSVYSVNMSRPGAVNLSFAYGASSSLTCDRIRVTNANGDPLDKVDVSYTVVGSAVTSFESRADRGVASLLALVQGARVVVSARQSIGGVEHKGELAFTARSPVRDWASMFADASGLWLPTARPDADCADDGANVLVLRPAATSASCGGRPMAAGRCLEY